MSTAPPGEGVAAVSAAATPGVFAGIVGQARAVADLSAALHRPVHAYLLVGPAGTQKLAAAHCFAAALLCARCGSCADEGSERCDDCRRVLAGLHPDVVVVEREGAAISIDMAREITRVAARSPVEGRRKVVVLPDFHLVRDAGPALLKTIEEPPPSTVFLVLAEYLPPELVTIASRCVRVEFAPLAHDDIVSVLVADGVDRERADELAVAAQGRLDRARLLAGDASALHRVAAWRSVPARLDGTGRTVAAIAGELVAALDDSVAVLRSRQELEVAALDERNARAVTVNGKQSRRQPKTGAKELEERHRREQRRQRTDELRAGLAALAGAYREGAASEIMAAEAAAGAVSLIDHMAADLAYNLGELLAIQALLVRLDGVSPKQG